MRSMGVALANIGQYLVPTICFVGAGLSFWSRRQRMALADQVTASKSSDALDGMTWREFEMLVGEAYRLQGFHVSETGGSGADGGIDLVLTKGREKSLVQCKQWKAYKVGVDVVRQLYGVMAANGAASGYVVTSGSFTKDAQSFAAGRNVTLVDGPQLFDMIKQARESLGPAAGQVRQVPTVAVVAPTVTLAEPRACPACGAAMVVRTAKQGSNAGSQFWGCSKYPACKGTRPVT